jgi:hypothetical protein
MIVTLLHYFISGNSDSFVNPLSILTMSDRREESPFPDWTMIKKRFAEIKIFWIVSLLTFLYLPLQGKH